MRACDKKAVSLYDSRADINFPIGSDEVSAPVEIDPRVVSCYELWENQEAI